MWAEGFALASLTLGGIFAGWGLVCALMSAMPPFLGGMRSKVLRSGLLSWASRLHVLNQGLEFSHSDMNSVVKPKP